MEKLKIGLVGTSQLSFPGDKDTAYAKCVSGLEKLAAEYGFGLAVYRETVITPDDAAKANAFFDEEKIDFQPVQCVNWAEYPYKPKVSFRIAHTKDSILLHFKVREESVRAKYGEDN